MVISHAHLDHLGGVGSQLRSTFDLSGEPVDLHGVPAYAPVALSNPTSRVTVVEGPRIIAPGVASMGPIPRQDFFFGETLEQSLALKVAGRGIVLVVGCGHPTVQAHSRAGGDGFRGARLRRRGRAALPGDGLAREQSGPADATHPGDGEVAVGPHRPRRGGRGRRLPEAPRRPPRRPTTVATGAWTTSARFSGPDTRTSWSAGRSSCGDRPATGGPCPWVNRCRPEVISDEKKRDERGEPRVEPYQVLRPDPRWTGPTCPPRPARRTASSGPTARARRRRCASCSGCCGPTPAKLGYLLVYPLAEFDFVNGKVQGISPFSHVPKLLVEEATVGPFFWLALTAAATSPRDHAQKTRRYPEREQE